MSIPTVNPPTICTEAVGRKATNIGLVADMGIRTPKGFGIPYKAYELHVQALLSTLESIRSCACSYGEMSARMRETIISVPLHMEHEILGTLSRKLQGVSYFAVRSSGAPVVAHKRIAEDSQEISLAGQFESFLMVPASQVPTAIKHCYASMFQERSLRQFDIKSDPSYLHSKMSVLIQEMCFADFCGVAMTIDPMDHRDVFGVEIAYGACEAIVSGQVQGDIYLIDRKSGQVLESEIGSKRTRISYVPFDPSLDNKVVSAVPIELQQGYAATPELISRVFNLCMRIEQSLGVPQDIEFVVSGDEIVITQTRPITCLPTKI